MVKPIVVIKDDREKKGAWTQQFLGRGFEVKTKRLITGDYTFEGLEDVVCIERKFGWAEIAQDVSKKQNRINFIKLLRRMSKFQVRVMVITSTFKGIWTERRYSQKVTPEMLRNWYINIVLEYDINVMLVGGAGSISMRDTIREMLRRIIEFNQTGRLYYHK